MNRVFCYALAAAAVLAAAMPFPAQAYCRGCAVGAGVIGGIAAGAIIGSAIGNSGPRGYEPSPVDAVPLPPLEDVDMPYEAMSNEALDSAACRVEQQRRWIDGAGYRWRTVEICE